MVVVWGPSGVKVWAEAEGDKVGMEPSAPVSSFAVPEIYIKAVNPGFTNKNEGEMIEVGSLMASPENMVSLAGIAISYTRASGEPNILAEFSETAQIASESFLLRFASSPESELANLTYRPSMVIGEGLVEIVRDGEVIDSVCWGSFEGEGCLKSFDAKKVRTYVRDAMSGEFEVDNEYEPTYDPEAIRVEDGAGEEGGLGGGGDGAFDDEKPSGGEVGSRCKGAVFSEILTYYAESRAEQFVEFYNTGSETVALDGCFVRYKNKDYKLYGMVDAEGYAVWYPQEFNFTKNPTNSNVVELIDADGAVLDRLEYMNGQRKGTSWAFIGYDAEGREIWRTTYAVTPGEANNYQEYKSCEEGKVINEETGNCVKVTEVADKVCAEGQYLNPLTGRCKKIEEETVTTCKEGYEINPLTGRCIKIKNNDGAEHPLAQESYEEETSFVAPVAVGVVVVVGLVYIGWEFRHEMRKLWRKVSRRFRR